MYLFRGPAKKLGQAEEQWTCDAVRVLQVEHDGVGVMPREEDGWGSGPEVLCGAYSPQAFSIPVATRRGLTFRTTGKQVRKCSLALTAAQVSTDQRGSL